MMRVLIAAWRRWRAQPVVTRITPEQFRWGRRL